MTKALCAMWISKRTEEATRSRRGDWASDDAVAMWDPTVASSCKTASTRGSIKEDAVATWPISVIDNRQQKMSNVRGAPQAMQIDVDYSHGHSVLTDEKKEQ